MERNRNIIWIPISLEDILRVTGAIGLPKDYIFTKATLGAKGAMSDDILMMGLDATNKEKPKLYIYPVEVKFSKNSSYAEKGLNQVSQTYKEMFRHLLGKANFTKNIYRTFFASQFLMSAEKLNANSLISGDDYKTIEECRFNLLNLRFEFEEELPYKNMGRAGLVCFYSNASKSMAIKNRNGVPVCEIHFSERECFKFIADPESSADYTVFLRESQIEALPEDLKFINCGPDENSAECPEITEIHDDYPSEDHPEVPAIPDNGPVEIENPQPNNTTQEDGESHPATKENPVDESSPTPIKIEIGTIKNTTKPVFFEPNNQKKVSHPNMGIIGTMGTGKTQLLRSIIAQFSKEGIHNVGGHPVGMLVFDYKGDYKDSDFLENVGGKVYAYKYPFNPLKLIIIPGMEGMNLPAITADRISDSFAKAYGLGPVQQNNIKQVIVNTYADAGITKDPSTWSKPVPVMENVIQKYFETYDSNDKAFALFDKLNDYTIFATDNEECVSIFEWLNKVRVIDLTMYPDDTKKVIVSLILDLFYAEMRLLGGSKQKDGLRELRAMVMVDEAHQFLKKDFNSFRNIISEGRMFGVGMLLSTQNADDFKSQKNDYTSFILSWAIHHVNSISKGEISNIFGSNNPNAEKYMNFISNAKIFESLCKIGNSVHAIEDLPFFRLIKEDSRFQNKLE